jgi:hypothetical protein
MSVKYILYQKNSQFIQLNGLKDQSVTPATYINDATLTATLYDSKNVAVAGANSIAGVFQVGSSGVYRFAVDPATFNPPSSSTGATYTLIVDGFKGAIKYHFEHGVKVKVRPDGTEG